MEKKYTVKNIDNFIFVENKGGKTLSFAKNSDVVLIEVDGYAFKDLNKNGKLDRYEDWRLPVEDRISDLLTQMTLEEIAGLMIYSHHLSVSSKTNTFSKKFAGTYDGKTLEESKKKVWELTDQQKEYLGENHIRHLLLTVVDDAYTSAKWNNQIQAFCEKMHLGIPANTSSDPRHTPDADTEFNAGSGGDISKWPTSLGMAAAFDPELMRHFGEIASIEYRAMGISTALSPQVDLATDPRWMRFDGTFGEDTKLAVDMAEAYCDGFQTSDNKGWGDQSVNAMVKHWPGGGSGEGGRDAHFGYGKFAVYPGNNFEEHLKPFTKGAFELKRGTKKASAVMPYYTISYDQDHKNNENVGNSYSKYIIKDLLRDKYGYDEVICTDWSVTSDNAAIDQFMTGKSWGVEQMNVVDRHYKIIEAGVDQFGGNHDIQPVLQAFEKGCQEHGKELMEKRIKESARRLLRNIFRCGLFENPYIDPEYAKETVGNKEFMEEGYKAQQKSVVMLKNHSNVLPIKKGKKVYIPTRYLEKKQDWFGNEISAQKKFPVEASIIKRYFDLVDNPQDADVALIFIDSPDSVGYDLNEGYKPITLQYSKYTAVNARGESIAKDNNDKIIDRNYKGKSNVPYNTKDLDIILETRKQMNGKPVIVSLNAKNPTVVGEFEAQIEGLLVNFGVQTQAILDCICGNYEPSGLLPFQMPKDMQTVEEQQEDVALDMECYTDADEHIYDFAFGMNFSGIINDLRVKRYKKGEQE